LTKINSKKNDNFGGINALCLYIAFIIGIGVSILGLIISRRSKYDIAMLICAFAFIIFLTALLTAALYQIDQRTSLFRGPYLGHTKKQDVINTNSIYVARYPRFQGWIIGTFGLFAVISIIYLVIHEYSLIKVSIFFGMFCLCFWCSVTVFITRLQFTKCQIIVNRPFFKRFSEPYSNIMNISYGISSIVLHFSNGRSLKIPFELGNPKIILAYLGKNGPYLEPTENHSRPK
jgi:hypothetical protein